MSRIKITKLHCDACENGIVKIKQTTRALSIHFSFSNCDVCGKVFGFMRTGNLKKVEDDVKESEVPND